MKEYRDGLLKGSEDSDVKKSDREKLAFAASHFSNCIDGIETGRFDRGDKTARFE